MLPSAEMCGLTFYPVVQLSHNVQHAEAKFTQRGRRQKAVVRLEAREEASSHCPRFPSNSFHHAKGDWFKAASVGGKMKLWFSGDAQAPRPQASLLPGPLTVKQSLVFRHHAAFKMFHSSLVKGQRREQRLKTGTPPRAREESEPRLPWLDFLTTGLWRWSSVHSRWMEAGS